MCDTICCVPPKIGTTEGLSSDFLKTSIPREKHYFASQLLAKCSNSRTKSLLSLNCRYTEAKRT